MATEGANTLFVHPNDRFGLNSGYNAMAMEGANTLCVHPNDRFGHGIDADDDDERD